MKLLAIVPAFNEEAAVGALVEQLLPLCERVLVIDDGSSDNTAQRARTAGAVVEVHPENRGKGAAMRTAFAYAEREQFDAAILLDGDGQHDPSKIPKFLQAYREHRYDLIIGSRMGQTEAMPWKRKITNRLMSSLLSRIARTRISDTQSGYRLLSRTVWQSITLTTSRYDTDSEILIQACAAGLRVGEVPIATLYRGEASQINKLVDSYRFGRLLVRLFWHSRPRFKRG